MMSATVEPRQPVVLVTGSAGHLGSALMMTLPSYGFQVFGIDILESSTTDAVLDISDPSQAGRPFSLRPDITHVIHAATLHKPHIVSHTKSDFIATNISGTLNLLEGARSTLAGPLSSFTYISTTSAFGAALNPGVGHPAAWIDESVPSIAKNIYGATKAAAEDICAIFNKDLAPDQRFPITVLRTSRFFPELDDDEARRGAELRSGDEVDIDENLKVCELAYRRVDIADIVTACVAAMKAAPSLPALFNRYIISAPTPIPNTVSSLRALHSGLASQVVSDAMLPAVDVGAAFARRKDWNFLPSAIDRVYDSSKAMRELGWEPEYTFARAVERIARGEEWRSELAIKVGKKGYHAVPTGIYTTAFRGGMAGG